MSHGITEKDTMFSYREVPWHGLGEVLAKRPKTIAEALRKAGLDWKVEQHPLITVPNAATVAEVAHGRPYSRRRATTIAADYQIDGYVANVRSDTGDVLGIVTPSYEPFHNQDAFEFADALLGESIYETAGSLWGGRQVFLLLAIPDHIEVGGDAVARYIYLRTRHDGTGALWAFPTCVRVVCANTDRMALDEVDQELVFRIAHRGDRSVQIHQARETMKITVNYAKQFKKFGDRLARSKLAERKMADVLAELYPGGPTDRAERSAERRRDAVMELFIHGDTVGNAPGSKWCGWNAIVEYEQHDKSVRASDPTLAAERRFVRAFEDPDNMQRRALDLVVSA